MGAEIKAVVETVGGSFDKQVYNSNIKIGHCLPNTNSNLDTQHGVFLFRDDEFPFC